MRRLLFGLAFALLFISQADAGPLRDRCSGHSNDRGRIFRRQESRGCGSFALLHRPRSDCHLGRRR